MMTISGIRPQILGWALCALLTVPITLNAQTKSTKKSSRDDSDRDRKPVVKQDDDRDTKSRSSWRIRPGTVVPKLSDRHKKVIIKGREYYHDDDSFFLSIGGDDFGFQFRVTRPPVGATLSYIPDDHRAVVVGQKRYIVHDDVYFEDLGRSGSDRYQVVDCPVGAWIERLPEEYRTVVVSGTSYYRVGDAYFRPDHRDGRQVYVREVIQAPPRVASVRGRVVLSERPSLPPNAVLLVRLLDTSHWGSEPLMVGEQTQWVTGSPTTPFEIEFNPSIIDPSHRYALQARIIVDDRTWFVSTGEYPVITGGHPEVVDLVLQPVAGAEQPEAPRISGTVVYPERIALPPNAAMTVSVYDLSQAQTPVLVGQQTILGAGQVPITFDMRLDPQIFDPRSQYAIQAAISVDGRTLYINPAMQLVLTGGHPGQIEIRVERMQ